MVPCARGVRVALRGPPRCRSARTGALPSSSRCELPVFAFGCVSRRRSGFARRILNTPCVAPRVECQKCVA
eukprot:8291556-Lingulodinium_polyedra.AAC.1